MRIHLRKRVSQLSGDSTAKGTKKMSSLYLAFQAPRQKTRYEWLKLYVYESPKTNLEKEHNKETMQLAESIRAKRMLDFQTTGNGFASSEKGKISFLEYFRLLAEKKADISNGNGGNWKRTYEHLKDYCNGADYTLESIDDRFLDGFKDYLSKDISRRGKGNINPNSALSYFNKVRASLREAYINKMIRENPCARIKGIKGKETHRQFLTFEELKQLVATPCDNELLRKAFLFSALTGLRWSDVRAMTWDKISYSEASAWTINYTQKKTKGSEVLPVSEQAIRVLGERLPGDQEIFDGLKYHTWMNEQLQNWVDEAGIKKKITFHCARHSFATLQLANDTDIYTVSKLLGHKHLKTTEIYTKVIDRKKIDAAKRIPELI
ncbi:MAG: transposase [Sphingobacteriales bacterium 50-39]|nr:site-specific integrase [Sphingobacteriales bacterium]OJW58372.1 MAG: transposase [Sphingobacteriales bacterium 50-39]